MAWMTIVGSRGNMNSTFELKGSSQCSRGTPFFTWMSTECSAEEYMSVSWGMNLALILCHPTDNTAHNINPPEYKKGTTTRKMRG
jgi:hypothetical protein